MRSSSPNRGRTQRKASDGGPIQRGCIRSRPGPSLPCCTVGNGDRFRNCRCKPVALARKAGSGERFGPQQKIVLGVEPRLSSLQGGSTGVSLSHRQPQGESR
jgi:hypothetical protein